MSDQVTEVWAYARPLIAEGKITEKLVRRLVMQGWRWKGDWAGKMKKVLDDLANKPQYPWQRRMQELGLKDINELALYDMLMERKGGIPEMRRCITNHDEFNAVIAEWEQRGWLEVKRNVHGKLLKIETTLAMPRVLEDLGDQNTPPG